MHIHDYGDMLFYGNGIEVNKDEAIRYYKMAIDNNHEQTMIQYMFILFRHQDVQFNLIEIYDYFKRLLEMNNDIMRQICSFSLDIMGLDESYEV